MSSTHRMRRFLDAKYKKDDIKKVMTEQCQQLSSSERESLLNLKKKLKFFDIIIGTWNTAPVDSEFKDDAKPV